jgi:hypothetical protein
MHVITVVRFQQRCHFHTAARRMYFWSYRTTYTHVRAHTHTHTHTHEISLPFLIHFIRSFAFHRSFDTEAVIYNMMYADRAFVMENKA